MDTVSENPQEQEARCEVLAASIQEKIEAAGASTDGRTYYGKLVIFLVTEMLGESHASRRHSADEEQLLRTFEEEVLEPINEHCDLSHNGELCKQYVLRSLFTWASGELLPR